MPFAPYQWRANQGYLPPTGSVPVPIITMPAAQPVPVYGHQISYPPGYFPPAQLVLAASPAPPAAAPASNAGPPPAKACSIAPSHSLSNTWSAAGSMKEKDLCCNYKLKCKKCACEKNGKCEGTFECTKPSTSGPCSKKPSAPPSHPPSVAGSCNTYAPPSLRPGVNYMFPKTSEHTMLHIFSKAAPIWEEKYHSQSLNFKMFKVSAEFKVQDVVKRILKSDDDEKCNAWAVTEVAESGSGVWRKGTTINFKDDKAKGNLASMGWTGKRGEDLPPVWLVVHKF